MTEIRHGLIAAILAIFVLALPGVVAAQIEVELNNPATLVAGAVAPGETVDVAIAFTPKEGWHGYWSNPGDAGLGMQLDWNLPPGWTAGEPRYPVPETYLAFGFMNHVFERPYAVLVPITAPDDARTGPTVIGLQAAYLTCSDELCVREETDLVATVLVGGEAAADPRFAGWRAAIPPMIDARGTIERVGNTLRVSIPLPETQMLGEPHLFVSNPELVDYAAPQQFFRSQDRLVAVLSARGDAQPQTLSGVLRFDLGDAGIEFAAGSGKVPIDGLTQLGTGMPAAVGWLLLGAFAGGVLLNILPCVFPILSLKAIHLARSGESEAAARRDALAYTAGVLVAVLALGGALLGLRAAGEQIGWAFQLQQPGVVVFLLVLVAGITANLLGLFELPTLGGNTAAGGSFGTGLLAAFIATPCTGPFMAAALGAALVLPTAAALGLFAALGLGLALPFLALGFVPALRNRLPQPGAWMERFRRWMAVPMGVTALALVWLCVRLGGWGFAAAAIAIALVVIALLMGVGRRQRSGKPVASGMVAGALAGVLALSIVAPRLAGEVAAGESILDPQPYSDIALMNAKASGQPVFLWFTADWCLTCKVNESVAIEREATREAFAGAGVIAMRGDWTRADPAITGYLESKGVAGVPLYVWIDADGTEQTLPQVLGPDALVDLATAAARADSDR